MKRVTFTLCSALALCAFAVFPALGQGSAGMSGTTPAFINDFLGDLSDVEEKLVSLEGAVPQEKFTWRPGEGVRSISEVYRHIAMGNYLFLKLMGYEPPAEANFHMDLKKWDTETTDKAAIASVMKASFDHLRNVAGNISSADLEKKVNLFGNEVTIRGGLIEALGHLHEHLGQSIAYARMNAIVPPWTTAQQAVEKETMKKEEQK